MAISNGWNKEGKKIAGLYMTMSNFPFVGIVIESRVGYGKNSPIHHTVKLNGPLMVYGELRETIIVSKGKDLFSIVEEE